MSNDDDFVQRPLERTGPVAGVRIESLNIKADSSVYNLNDPHLQKMLAERNRKLLEARALAVKIDHKVLSRQEAIYHKQEVLLFVHTENEAKRRALKNVIDTLRDISMDVVRRPFYYRYYLTPDKSLLCDLGFIFSNCNVKISSQAQHDVFIKRLSDLRKIYDRL